MLLDPERKVVGVSPMAICHKHQPAKRIPVSNRASLVFIEERCSLFLMESITFFLFDVSVMSFR